MATRQLSGKKPKNLRHTLHRLLDYMGRHKFLLLIVAVLVTISALANLIGTYMIRPVVNHPGPGEPAGSCGGGGGDRGHLRRGRPCPPWDIPRPW